MRIKGPGDKGVGPLGPAAGDSIDRKAAFEVEGARGAGQAKGSSLVRALGLLKRRMERGEIQGFEGVVAALVEEVVTERFGGLLADPEVRERAIREVSLAVAEDPALALKIKEMLASLG